MALKSKDGNKKHMTQIFKFWVQIWNQREKLYKIHFTSRRGIFFQNLTSKAALCPVNYRIAGYAIAGDSGSPGAMCHDTYYAPRPNGYRVR